MNCGLDEDGSPLWPESLGFIASVAGSCPQADVAIESGLVTAQPVRCDDVPDEGATYCDNIYPGLCACFYSWGRDPLSIPPCGPFIESVVLQCLDVGRWYLPADCPHLKHAKRIWYVQVNVARAVVYSPSRAVSCFTPDDETDVAICRVQNCETCAYSDLPEGSDENDLNPCCPNCPQCFYDPAFPPGDLENVVCDDNVECCGHAGCQACVCPTDPPCTGDCDQCTSCIEYPPFVVGSGTVDPSCPVPFTFSRPARYHWWHYTCPDPDHLQGCSATACPPDTKNTGPFYLRVQCNENDFVEFFCV